MIISEELAWVVAQILFKDDFPLRVWDSAKQPQKNKYFDRVKRAMLKVQCEDLRVAAEKARRV